MRKKGKKECVFHEMWEFPQRDGRLQKYWGAKTRFCCFGPGVVGCKDLVQGEKGTNEGGSSVIR